MGVVVSGRKVLLVEAKSTPGAWVPPGGMIEPREPAVEAAAREVLEETGVAVEVGRLIGYGQAWRERDDLLELYFAARAVDSLSHDPAPGPEGRQGRWVPVDELETIRHFPEALGRLCELAAEDAYDVLHLGCRDLR